MPVLAAASAAASAEVSALASAEVSALASAAVSAEVSAEVSALASAAVASESAVWGQGPPGRPEYREDPRAEQGDRYLVLELVRDYGKELCCRSADCPPEQLC